jgi:uncharacterized membrane protein
MLWIKALHIVFIASWFAGLFYLPRIFVNLAMVEPSSVAERARLLLMSRKLYRFMTILAVPALALGLWLWLYYGIGLGPAKAGCTPSWRSCWPCLATTTAVVFCCANSKRSDAAQPRLVSLVQ